MVSIPLKHHINKSILIDKLKRKRRKQMLSKSGKGLLKRIMSMILSFVMVFSLMNGLVLVEKAEAASNPYPVNNWGSTGEWSNCTWSVWQLVYDNLGIALPGGWGNAGSSWLSNARNAGYTTGSSPKVNSIIVFDGHVAFVTYVSGDQVYIKEGGYGYAPNQTYHEGWCNA